MLEASELSTGYRKKVLLKNISLTLKPGNLSMLIGPNGSGKTTLIHALARVMPAHSGEVRLNDRLLSSYKTKALARQLALLPQVRKIPDLDVETLTAQGRYPHHGYFSSLSSSDEDKIDYALKRCGIDHLRKRNLTTLSGGERQRAYLAMLLAQDADLMLLDEPTTFLDISQQLEILDLLRELCAQGKTILTVLHDLSLALRYADTLFLLNNGDLIGEYTADGLINSGKLKDVFGVCVHSFCDGGDSFVGFSTKP
ncbi:MAG: ABC transporter ATP-binding protein [Clostridiales bacterium]|nr:ABC transporter ATP-binding protein [Clostridiales bacterium]